jgi:transposase
MLVTQGILASLVFQVTVKMVKRQMYDRANVGLLRRRILAAT